ncbi:MAG: TrmH family RNA methyltransferase [Pseudomonadota bacterium]
MEYRLHLALYQPDIAPNVGACTRLAAALGLPLALIEPFGFVYDLRKLSRVALDYQRLAEVTRHSGFAAFETWRARSRRRLVLLTTAAATPYTQAVYRPGDVLLAGRESAGVPDDVHAAADVSVVVPMAAGARSLNVVTALAMVAGEALRQVGPQGPNDTKSELQRPEERA